MMKDEKSRNDDSLEGFERMMEDLKPYLPKPKGIFNPPPTEYRINRIKTDYKSNRPNFY